MRDAKGMQNDLAKERQRKIEQRTNKGQTTFWGGVDVCREWATNKERTKRNPVFGVVASGAGNLQTNRERAERNPDFDVSHDEQMSEGEKVTKVTPIKGSGVNCLPFLFGGLGESL